MEDHQYHGKCIDSGTPANFPRRSDFTTLNYRNIPVSKSVIKSVKALKPKGDSKVLFLPNDIRAMDYKSGGTSDYRIFMFGITMDGSKSLVVLKNIPVYFDIRYPNDVVNADNFDIASSRFISRVRENYLMNTKYERAYPLQSKIETVWGYPLKGFHKKPVPYLRVWFNTLYRRKEALDKLQPYDVEHANVCAQPYELASNDTSNEYHNKISRDFKYYTCGWNYFTSGRVVNSSIYSNNCKYVFEVDVADFHAYDLTPMDLLTPREGDSEEEIARRKHKNVEIAAINKDREERKNKFGFVLEKDRTMTCAWDIETHNELISDKFKSANQFEIFMICLTFHWHHSQDALVKVCLVNKPTNPDDGWLTIVCDNERALLNAFIEILARMAPDVMCAFNGGNFDWNCTNIKLRHYKMENVFKTRVSCLKFTDDYERKKYRIDRPVKIKISADQPTYEMTICDLPGMIDTDVMPVFKQLYTRSEIGRFQGLNFFAQKNKLGSKEDMPYKVMFAIYEGKRVLEYDTKRQRVVSQRDATPEENLEDMREVARYCVKDALLCQQLYAVRNILFDKRELSNMSRVTLWDSFYRAGGSKVLNTLGFYCDWYDEQEDIKFNIMFDNHHHKKKNLSYPGGYVPEPERGLENKEPVTGLDFTSLYPSLQMTYNFSPDKTVKDPAVAVKLKEEGYELHDVHVPVTIKSKDINGVEVTTTEDQYGWVVRHSEHKPVNQRLPGESMGIIPYILRKLFAERLKVKLEKLALEEQEESMKVQGLDNTDEFTDVLFRLDATDTKQKAMKVIMNTFYGKAGDSSSSIFELLVSGGITEMGQRNIKFVAKLAEDIGCRRKYGDTDSVYVTCPRSTYEELDAQYARDVALLHVEDPNRKAGESTISPDVAEDNKSAYHALTLAYHEEKVRLTMKRVAEIRDYINKALIADNGTKYLKIAYEEVLYPAYFTGKKKYFGIAHMGEPKFTEIKTIGDIFVRGIDIIKQGQTELAKKVGFELMKDILNLFNKRSMMELVKEKIRTIYTTTWDTNYFVQKLKYRPDKKNVRVHRFVDRMKEERRIYENDPILSLLYRVPEAGEPFECVVVKKSPIYTTEYKQVKVNVGDQMEYVEVYEHSLTTDYPMEIDMDYYIRGSIIGLFARFLSYYPEFNASTDAELIKKATKYVGGLCKQIQEESGVVESVVTDEEMQRNRKWFTNSKSKFTKHLQKSMCGGAAILSQFETDERGVAKAPPTKILTTVFDKINDKAINVAVKGIDNNYGKHMISRMMALNNIRAELFDDVVNNVVVSLPPHASDDVRTQITRMYAERANLPTLTYVKLNALYGVNGSITHMRNTIVKSRIGMLKEKLGTIYGELFKIASVRDTSVMRLVQDRNTEKTDEEVNVDEEDLDHLLALSEDQREVIAEVNKIFNDLVTLHRITHKDMLVRCAISAKISQIDEHKFVVKDVEVPKELLGLDLIAMD